MRVDWEFCHRKTLDGAEHSFSGLNELLSLWVTGPETPTKVGLTVITLILTKVDKLDRIGGS